MTFQQTWFVRLKTTTIVCVILTLSTPEATLKWLEIWLIITGIYFRRPALETSDLNGVQWGYMIGLQKHENRPSFQKAS